MPLPSDSDWWPEGPIPAPGPPAEESPATVIEVIDEAGPSRQGRFGMVLVTAIVAGAIGGLATWGTLAATGALDDDGVTANPALTRGVTTVELAVADSEDAPNDIGEVADRVLPSVVQVVVYEQNGEDENGDPLLFPAGSGSGVGYTAEGHILTNNHVVEGAELIEIELVDGRVYEAVLVGRDELTDVAVLKTEPGLVEPIAIADRGSIDLGDPAIAIGNPLGLAGGPSVSVGIVSAFERQLDIERPGGDSRNLQGLIQTDAAISGGSSGGALVDQNGALIGITTAKSIGDSVEGVGFAIPVDLVENIALDLIANGSINHPFLGILGQTFYEELEDGARTPAGAVVSEIFDGTGDFADITESAFGDAGAEEDDVIVAFDGEEIQNMNELASLLRRYRAGQEVEVIVDRNGSSVPIVVTLGERPDVP